MIIPVLIPERAGVPLRNTFKGHLRLIARGSAGLQIAEPRPAEKSTLTAFEHRTATRARRFIGIQFYTICLLTLSGHPSCR